MDGKDGCGKVRVIESAEVLPWQKPGYRQPSPEELKASLENLDFGFGPVPVSGPCNWITEELKAGFADPGVTVVGFWSGGRGGKK